MSYIDKKDVTKPKTNKSVYVNTTRSNSLLTRLSRESMDDLEEDIELVSQPTGHFDSGVNYSMQEKDVSKTEGPEL